MSRNIIILGAGYGGIAATQQLNKLLKNNDDFTITLINNSPYHVLLSGIHEVAGNRIDSEGVQISLDELFSSTKVNIIEDHITDIDFTAKTLQSDRYVYKYDYLVLATGSKANDRQVKGINEYAFTLWSLEDAEKIKKHIHSCFHEARLATDTKNRKELLSFAIIGGGFTGVEMTGELLEWTSSLCRQYDIPEEEVRLFLVEGLDRILPNFKERLADKASSYLKKRGVQLKLGSFVKEVKENGLILDSGEEIASRTVIWNCGVTASDIAGKLNLQSEKDGRIKVNEYLQTLDYPEVYAIGDNAATPWNDKRILPALVEAALQTGKTAAINIAADINGQTKEKIKAKLHGIMVSIGGRYGIADLMGISLRGWPANFMKHMVNIHYLLTIGGLKNGAKYTLDYLETQGQGNDLASRILGHISQRGYSLFFAILRIFLGTQWLLSALDKLNSGWLIYSDKLVAGASTSPIGPNPVGWYVDFMEAVVFPNAIIFQYMITLGELALGIALLLGIFTPLAALGSAFMSINFFLSGFYPENPTLPWWLFSSLAVIGAGRALSVDYYLLPWLKKIIWRNRKGKSEDLKKVVKHP